MSVLAPLPSLFVPVNPMLASSFTLSVVTPTRTDALRTIFSAASPTPKATTSASFSSRAPPVVSPSMSGLTSTGSYTVPVVASLASAAPSPTSTATSSMPSFVTPQ